MRRAGRLLGSALLAFLALDLAFGAPAASTAQATPPTGCVSDTGTGGACADGTALDGATGVVVSPDGTSVYVASETSRSVSVFSRDQTSGVIAQLAGTSGCISETGTGGACTDGRALVGPRSVALSPDGKNFYFPASGSAAVSVFSRDEATGRLTQLPGLEGCVSETGTSGACANGTALGGARAAAVSPDGKSVYVASFFSDAIAVFSRDQTTGALTQLAGTSGCVSETGTGGACGDGRALVRTRFIAVSPDGKNVYVASETSGAVSVFSRDVPSGALTQLAGTDGCVSEAGTGGACADSTALGGAAAVAVSPDGKYIYVASLSSDAVSVFSRDETTGALTQLAGTAGCISETGTGGACVDGTALDRVRSVALSPDGTNVYVAAETSGAVSAFSRNETTGELTQLVTTDGCVSESGTGGACADGTALGSTRSVAVSPDGKSVYAASFGSSAVSIFSRSETTGALTQLTTSPPPPPPPPPPDGGAVYLSLGAAATVGGVAAANEDILFFDGTSFSLTFDGSDVGLGSLRIDAFAWLDADSLLLSFDTPGSVPGIAGTVDDSDVVRFDASELGPATMGGFSMYFDGSDVGLTTNAHDLDACELLGDGRILISTLGAVTAGGASSADEDVLAFTPSSLGENTAGSFALYFDGSDVGLTASGEDVDAAAVDASGTISLSTLGLFAVTGVSGADEDVFAFTPSSLGPVTSGSYSPTLHFDGSAFGLSANDVFAVDLP